MKIFGKDCGCTRRRKVWLEWMLDHPTIIRAACAVAIAVAIALSVRSCRAEPYVNVQTCVKGYTFCNRADPHAFHEAGIRWQQDC